MPYTVLLSKLECCENVSRNIRLVFREADEATLIVPLQVFALRLSAANTV
jgi:hypothetical protein